MNIWLLICAAWGILFIVTLYLVQIQKQIRLELFRDVTSQYMELMRGHRHDWMNHFQVVYGYIQLQKTARALDYINHISQTTQEIAGIFRLGQPELTALFMHIIMRAEGKEIEVEFEFVDELPSLEANLEIALDAWKQAFSYGCKMIEQEVHEERVIYLRLLKKEQRYGVLCEVNDTMAFFPFIEKGWVRNQIFIWKRLISIKQKGQNLFE